MDRFLKLCISVTVIIIGLSLFYCFFYFLPDRESKQHKLKELEISSNERLKNQIVEEQNKRKQDAKQELQICFTNAYTNYMNDWSNYCKLLSLSKNCSLPQIAASVFNERHEKLRKECIDIYSVDIRSIDNGTSTKGNELKTIKPRSLAEIHKDNEAKTNKKSKTVDHTTDRLGDEFLNFENADNGYQKDCSLCESQKDDLENELNDIKDNVSVLRYEVDTLMTIIGRVPDLDIVGEDYHDMGYALGEASDAFVEIKKQANNVNDSLETIENTLP